MTFHIAISDITVKHIYYIHTFYDSQWQYNISSHAQSMLTFFSVVSFLCSAIFSIPLLSAFHHSGPRELYADTAGSGSGCSGSYRQQKAAVPTGPRAFFSLSSANYSGGCWVFYAIAALLRQPGCHFDVCCSRHIVECLLHWILSLWSQNGRGYRWVIMGCQFKPIEPNTNS